MTRNWTDEQDASAYEIFCHIANNESVERAESLLLQTRESFGLGFDERDVEAWRSRYEDEQA